VERLLEEHSLAELHQARRGWMKLDGLVYAVLMCQGRDEPTMSEFAGIMNDVERLLFAEGPA
jgi:hypothetical protein